MITHDYLDEKFIRYLRTANEKETEEVLSDDEKSALFYFARVPFSAAIEGLSFKMKFNPCGLARIDGKWHVFMMGGEV